MSTFGQLKNGPRADETFLALVQHAAEEEKREIARKPVVDGFTPLIATHSCDSVTRHFLQSLKSSSDKILPLDFESPTRRGVFLFQKYNPSTPPNYVSIMIPIIISENLRAQENVVLEVGCPIYVDEKATLQLSGSGFLVSINIAFKKQPQVGHTA
ncbi:hypothetical protein EAF04_001849 [Stromatinia cepivora]|nr:hypothetical protein EAF04_001849 [Stromatinia cepivora]